MYFCMGDDGASIDGWSMAVFGVTCVLEPRLKGGAWRELELDETGDALTTVCCAIWFGLLCGGGLAGRVRGKGRGVLED